MDVRKLAKKLYDNSIHKRQGVEFEQLPLYEQGLWDQSARQTIKNQGAFGYTIKED